MKLVSAIVLISLVGCVICEQILYDTKHHKAVIYRPGTGCYVYHLNHEETQESYDDSMRPDLEKKISAALDCSNDIHEVGHHSIDHLSAEIKTMCASVPVYGFDQTSANCASTTMAPTSSDPPTTSMDPPTTTSMDPPTTT
ncbi:uncharacterized protein LOC111110492 [Crassostrea virginica]|uniref:Uncharacterized protein LOC111110492 n=1 Tax=Crassostrea virginica TaxID=6565 RepID=A0A8B8BH73_CRAVI|nr:uncharacterized protein LOC111110492 [Crassostrea virginica]